MWPAIERCSLLSHSIHPIETRFDGRPGLSLRSKWGQVTVLLGGGHICELRSHAHPDLNPLWRPLWAGIDPGEYRADQHSTTYGPNPDGALLAGIAGHSLSFDYFGPPSAEEAAAGLTTHGEAPASQWHLRREFDSGIEYGVLLPIAQIDFCRILRIDPEQPVVYCEEIARSLSSADRPISWNEHVTIGPPFLACDTTLVDMPATQSKVIWATYSDEMELTPDAIFAWPKAPRKGGGFHDLRTTPEGRYSRYTAQLIDPSLIFGYTAISNSVRGLLLLYLFPRSDFPWVGNWEERHSRVFAPWNGKAFCRGIEFSTTPFAQPKRDTVSNGPLFGEETYRWLPAKSERRIRFATLLLSIPTDFQGVERVSVEQETVRIYERGRARTLSQQIDRAFFNGTAA